MPQPNIKLYLALSGALIVLFLSVLLIPFGKKTAPENNQVIGPTPTSIDTGSYSNEVSTNEHEETGFTGVKDVTIAPEMENFSNQKQDLRRKTPLTLPSSTIEFDYGENKFVVTLNDPKDLARREFEDWRKANYPALGEDQFIFK